MAVVLTTIDESLTFPACKESGGRASFSTCPEGRENPNRRERGVTNVG
jgi:hypothetical protein